MIQRTLSGVFLVSTLLIFSSCDAFYNFAIAMTTDNCERYSVYRSTIFGDDELLWEETSCDGDRDGIEGRFKEKMTYYEDFYSSSNVYSEHVTYSQH